MLFTRCTSAISRSEESCYEVIKASISLVLTSIGYFETCSDNPDVSKMKTKKLGDLDMSLKRWITQKRVIGGKMFGESVEGFNKQYLNKLLCQAEIQVRMSCIPQFSIYSTHQPAWLIFQFSVKKWCNFMLWLGEVVKSILCSKVVIEVQIAEPKLLLTEYKFIPNRIIIYVNYKYHRSW